jgi:hypothetical protein
MQPINQNMQVLVQLRTVYGVDTVYPVCDNAKAFASIARTKTLTLDTLGQVKALGFEIINQPAQSNVSRFLTT